MRQRGGTAACLGQWQGRMSVPVLSRHIQHTGESCMKGMGGPGSLGAAPKWTLPRHRCPLWVVAFAGPHPCSWRPQEMPKH